MSLPPVEIRDEAGAVVISIETVEAWRRRYAKDACPHVRIKLDRILATVECSDCHEKLNPVEWIAMAAEHWGSVQRTYEAQRTAAAELELKRKAKCQHCGRISEVRHPTASELRAWSKQDRSRRIKDGSLIVVGAPGGSGRGDGGRDGR